ncbi:MAG: flavodoxin-dependent (E)-4-hydroxy-3-methylbut-2-enyl-diphosphate synthase [Candidatus Aureabacteria bacterium]|nr:flavodoxin-dependent (E)-4-hydroxy-3-methylbut-2-enyl-diphosphate synthase [Candidatus Auribacterota bacterium]
MKRKRTKKFYIRDTAIGGNSPITIQSMTKVPTSDTKEVIRHIKKLALSGCDIIRLAVLNKKDALSLGKIVSSSPIPVIADIHFSKELALLSLKQGVDGIRINPGNITKKSDWKLIAKEIKKRNTVLRIGVNSGSLPEKKEYHNLNEVDKLVLPCLDAVHFFEAQGVKKIKISLKASNVLETVAAYEKISKKTSWPLHVGVTATGTGDTGIVKASIGIGSLLCQGIGDTIRVSLNDPSLREITVAKSILQSLNLRKFGIEVIACPGCGRSQVAILKLAKQVEASVKKIHKNIKIAVMGCIVNGPGEAKDADLGIAGGKGEALIFKKGAIIARIKEKDIIKVLLSEINKI